MNATHLIALYFAIPVGMLILCGTFVRVSARRAGDSGKTPNRLARDLRPWEDALVDFVAHSKDSSAILGALATRRWPMPFRALVDALRLQSAPDGDRMDAPSSVVRSVLFVLQVSRLVGWSRAGFWLTEAGHEVHRRMLSRTGPALPTRQDRQQSRRTEPLLAQTRQRLLRAA